MDTLKWLELAAEHNGIRPPLTWGYQTEIAGEPVTLATDGYVIHWVHEQSWDDVIPFKRSSGALPTFFLDSLPEKILRVVDAEVRVQTKVNPRAFESATRAARVCATEHDFIRCAYDPAGFLDVLQWDYSGFVRTRLVVGASRPKPLRVTFSAALVLRALRYFSGKKHPPIDLMFVGYPGHETHAMVLGVANRAMGWIMLAKDNGGIYEFPPELSYWPTLPTK